MRPVAVALLLVAIGAAAVSAQSPASAEGWQRVQTQSFELLGNVEPGTLATLAVEIERLAAVLSSLGGDRSHGLPTTVLVFRGRDDFAPYDVVAARRSHVAGFFLSHPYGRMVAVDASARRRPQETLYHELLHDWADRFLPRVPLWLNEGLAEYYSTFEGAPAGASLGVPIANHVEWLRHNELRPMERLMAADPRGGLGERAPRAGFYAQSWLSMHMLLSDAPGRAQLRAYLSALARYEDPSDAFDDSFGSPAEFTRRLERYLERGELLAYEISVPPQGADVGSVNAAAPAEVLTRLGWLLASFEPPRADAARRHFAAAERQRHLADAEAGLGYVRQVDGDLSGALAVYEHALSELGLRSHRLYFSAARARHRRAQSAGLTPAERQGHLRQAMADYRRAIDLEPRFAEAWAGLGACYVTADVDPGDGAAVLQRARAMLPDRADVTYNLILVLAKSGRVAAAEEMRTDVLRRQGGAELADQAREAMLRFDLERAEELVAADELPAARRIFESVQLATRSNDLFAELANRIAEIDRIETRRTQVRRYDEAAALVTSGRYLEAESRLRELLREVEDADLERVIRKLLRDLQRVSGGG